MIAGIVHLIFKQDYNNWLEDTRRVWNVPAVLPPIQHSTEHPQFHHQLAAGDSDTHRSRTYPAGSHEAVRYYVLVPVFDFCNKTGLQLKHEKPKKTLVVLLLFHVQGNLVNSTSIVSNSRLNHHLLGLTIIMYHISFIA